MKRTIAYLCGRLLFVRAYLGTAICWVAAYFLLAGLFGEASTRMTVFAAASLLLIGRDTKNALVDLEQVRGCYECADPRVDRSGRWCAQCEAGLVRDITEAAA